MTYQPELLATAASLEELERLASAGADAFVAGDARFGVRLAGHFDADGLKAAVSLAHAQGKKLYAAVNNLIHNDSLEALQRHLAFLSEIGVDAIVFGDPAVLMAARRHAPDVPLHWNAEMTSTNYATAEYWRRRGASRFVLARELNMEQIEEIRAATDMELQVQVHGMTNIYHSKRKLVGSYLDHLHGGGNSEATRGGMHLTEQERPGERYPIFEDASGTHIMSSDDICMLENLHELLGIGVNSLKIEGMLKPIEYNEIVVRAYRQAIDAYMADPEGYVFREKWLGPIREAQDPDRELSYGFFYKEQVY